MLWSWYVTHLKPLSMYCLKTFTWGQCCISSSKASTAPQAKTSSPVFSPGHLCVWVLPENKSCCQTRVSYLKKNKCLWWKKVRPYHEAFSFLWTITSTAVESIPAVVDSFCGIPNLKDHQPWSCVALQFKIMGDPPEPFVLARMRGKTLEPEQSCRFITCNIGKLCVETFYFFVRLKL